MREPAAVIAARRGARLRALRAELGKLDDRALLRRLARYTGRSPAAELTRHRDYHVSRSSPGALRRSAVEDEIVSYEIP